MSIRIMAMRPAIEGLSAVGARIALVSPLVLLAACGQQAPTVEEIREAYAAHMRRDPVHERGLRAKDAPAVIPQQEPQCTPDGRTHFDCRIRVVFETPAGRHSQEQAVHIKLERGTWSVESIN